MGLQLFTRLDESRTAPPLQQVKRQASSLFPFSPCQVHRRLVQEVHHARELAEDMQ